jgi:hypothetical protein
LPRKYRFYGLHFLCLIIGLTIPAQDAALAWRIGRIMNSDRRNLLKLLAAGTLPLPHAVAGEKQAGGKVRIGLIADVHQDLVHDGPHRLKEFLAKAAEWKADAVLELGDFCTPKPANREFADAFEVFSGKRFHVIGNHDTDGGFDRDQVVAFHKMPARYYSADLHGIHLVVLDANDVPPGHKGGYPSHIADDQIEWLAQDLAATTLPVFVFSHQSLERPECIRSQEKVRAVLEKAKRPDGSNQVVACLNGHWHIDHARVINGISYIHVNSASYYWIGERFAHVRYSKEIDALNPYMPFIAPYRKPIFSLLEVDLDKGEFSLSACESEWVGPSPQQLGVDFKELDSAWVAAKCSARKGKLSNR